MNEVTAVTLETKPRRKINRNVLHDLSKDYSDGTVRKPMIIGLPYVFILGSGKVIVRGCTLGCYISGTISKGILGTAGAISELVPLVSQDSCLRKDTRLVVSQEFMGNRKL